MGDKEGEWLEKEIDQCLFANSIQAKQKCIKGKKEKREERYREKGPQKERTQRQERRKPEKNQKAWERKQRRKRKKKEDKTGWGKKEYLIFWPFPSKAKNIIPTSQNREERSFKKNRQKKVTTKQNKRKGRKKD